jgi:hypothetical protein
MGGTVLGDLLSILRTHYKPGPGQFLQIDPKFIIEQMDLRQRGIERGAAEQPPTESNSFDAVEQEIESAIRTMASDDQGRTYDQVATYEQRLRAADIGGASADMRVLARQAETDMESALLAIKGDLKVARREVIERERALAKFKADNDLDRPARPAHGILKIVFVAILLVLFAIETLPNAVILGEGEELGIVGGYTVAIIFSAVNLCMGFGSSRFGWANAIHKNFLRKVGGSILALSLLCGVLLINLALAHYRAAIESGMTASQAASAVVPMMVNSPFVISDIKSVIMVVLGVIFALVAMLEGWFWSEPYPHYGAISKYLRDAQDHFHGLVEAKLDHLKDVQEEFVGKIQLERSRLRDRRQERPIILQERQRLIARYRVQIGHLQDVGRQLLTVYRDANRSGRKTPAPARFDEPWSLSGFENIEVIELPAIPETEFNKAYKALEESIDRLQSANEEGIRWIRNLSEMDVHPSEVRDAEEASK